MPDLTDRRYDDPPLSLPKNVGEGAASRTVSIELRARQDPERCSSHGHARRLRRRLQLAGQLAGGGGPSLVPLLTPSRPTNASEAKLALLNASFDELGVPPITSGVPPPLQLDANQTGVYWDNVTCPLPCCLTAPLPCCLAALLPHCLTTSLPHASLPHCLTVSLPHRLTASLPRCSAALLL